LPGRIMLGQVHIPAAHPTAFDSLFPVCCLDRNCLKSVASWPG